MINVDAKTLAHCEANKMKKFKIFSMKDSGKYDIDNNYGGNCNKR